MSRTPQGLPTIHRNSHSSHGSDKMFQKIGSLSFQKTENTRYENSRYNPTESKRNTYGSNKFDYRHASVLPLSEFERIRSQYLSMDDTNQDKLSRSLNPTKTAQNARERRIMEDYEKKKKEQLDRFVKKEEAQRLIDEQEEEYRKQKNKLTLQKANQQIFDRNENVRELKRKLLYSDMLEEQKHLNEVKKHIDEQKVEQEEYFRLQDEIRRQEEYDKIVSEEEIRKKKKEVTKQMIKQQVLDAKERAKQEYQAGIMEGEMMKEAAQEAMRAEEEKQMRLKQKHLQLVEEMNEKLREQQAYKRELQKQERLEDQKIEREKQQKEQIQALKDQRSKVMADQIRKQKDLMIEQGTKKLMEMKNNEDHRISNQIQETDKKNQEKERLKQAKRQQLKDEIDKSIQISIQKRKEQKEQEKLADQRYVQQVSSNFAELDRLDQEEKKFHLQKEIELKKYQLQQIEEKNKRKKEDFIAELNEDERIKKGLEMDKRVFNTWADNVVDEYQRDGKDVTTVVKKVHQIRQNI